MSGTSIVQEDGTPSTSDKICTSWDFSLQKSSACVELGAAKSSPFPCGLLFTYQLQIAATHIHESLLSLLPVDAKEEHETWFKAKNISNNEVIS